MVVRYVPEAGGIVWVHFKCQAGHEQPGHRPAPVISPSVYNGRTELMLCCRMAAQIKGYPFEVLIAGDRTGATLADQVKSLDWVACKAQHKGRVSTAELNEVRAKFLALLSSELQQ
jgi:mRNA interferase MazF